MKTHFGFQTVEESEKQEKVTEVFDSVASRYDIMNDAMSFGLHRVWKRRMVQLLPSHPKQILDVAGGTGDIAFRMKKAKPEAEITICDINSAMLKEGRARAVNQGLIHGFHWQEGNAETLPFESNHFDVYTIAFGIRNVTHIDKALEEAYRVLKPGGKFICLEFSHVQKPLDKIYDAYSFHVIPRMGQLIAGKPEAYQYLVESIRQFPKAHDFKRMIEAAGFAKVSFETLTFGVVAIHTGWKC